jgi:hypothetical protein
MAPPLLYNETSLRRRLAAPGNSLHGVLSVKHKARLKTLGRRGSFAVWAGVMGHRAHAVFLIGFGGQIWPLLTDTVENRFWGSPSNIDSQLTSNGQVRFKKSTPMIPLLRVRSMPRTLSTASTQGRPNYEVPRGLFLLVRNYMSSGNPRSGKTMLAVSGQKRKRLESQSSPTIQRPE